MGSVVLRTRLITTLIPMKILLIIIAVALIFWIRSLIFNKIDRDEAVALATPGRANFIRDNYNQVLGYILSIPNAQIEFERADQIRILFGRDKERLSINSYSGGLLIALVKWSSVQKEWRFSSNEKPQHIIYELKKYFG